MSAIALLGGTFDPVHNGHLRLAIEAMERLPVDTLRLVPVHHPHHREAPVATPAQRLRMLERAVAGVPGLAVDDRELRRGGTSYTVETLESLRGEVGDAPILWVLGMDSFAGLPDWHRWRELPGLAHLVVASRPGASLPASGALGELVAARRTGDRALLAGAPAGKLFVVSMPMLDISSSAIREALAAGRCVRFLLPDPVLQIIEEDDLYRHGA